MGRRYEQLSLDDRCEIARLQANGCSIRQIAAALDRAPSSISREIRRNRGREVGYKPSYAQDQSRPRPGPPRHGLVSRTSRRKAGARGRPNGDQLREHLSLHPRPDRPHQGLPLAALSAPRQEPARVSRPQGRQFGKLRLTAVWACPNGPARPPIARPRATGKPTSCCSPDTVRPCSPSTSASPACCWRPGRPTRPPTALRGISCGSSPTCR